MTIEVQQTQHPDWRNEQERSRYPFSDRASLKTAEGMDLGADTFLDASLYPIGAAARVYLSRVLVEHNKVTITLGDSRAPALASAEFDPRAAPDILRFEDEFGRPAGVLVSEAERLAVFQAWPLQEHRFTADASEFVASVVVPVPDIGLRGFLLDDGSIISGDVWLIGEDGVVVRGEGGDIRIDIVGDPLFRRRLCQPAELFTTPNFIKTINGIAPDENGDFKITAGSQQAADTILRIYAYADGLRIEAVGQQLKGVR